MRSDVVETLQHCETADGRWYANGGKAGMARSRVGAAVIHRGRNGDAGWHFVIEQSAYALTQRRRDGVVLAVVASICTRIDTSLSLIHI